MTSICVLLATKNGEEFIIPFLESLIQQNYAITELLISDDGSQDSTVKILHKILNGRINYRIVQGPNRGATENFFSLLNEAGEFDFYAFADQDDIWERFHLSRAIELMSKMGDAPKLTYSQTNKEKFTSKRKTNYKTTNMNKLLFNNPARGCTIVFNRSLLKLLVNQDLREIQYHDWMIALAAAAFGDVYAFVTPSVWYRKHENQLIGPQKGVMHLWQKMSRFNSGIDQTIAMCKLVLRIQNEAEGRSPSLPELWSVVKEVNYLERLKILTVVKPKSSSCLKTTFGWIKLLST